MNEAAMLITDTTILTNGTKPLRKNIPQLLKIEKSSPYELFLRISLDHYQEARHDLIRGKGKFAETFETVRLLTDSGFENIIITPTAEVYRGTPMTESQARSVYRTLFLNEGLPGEGKVVPSILETGAHAKRPRPNHSLGSFTKS